MGAIFNTMSVTLAKNLEDARDDNGQPITTAADDGKKRTSAQRSKDLMDGRYFVQQLLRAIDKEMFYGVQSGKSFDSSGFLDVTAYGITSYRDISLSETTPAYNDIVPLVPGDALPLYRRLLRSSRARGLMAAVVSDNAAAVRTIRLQLIKGSALTTNVQSFVFDVGYYTVPKLEELTAASSNDLTEPRVFHPVIEAYALYLGWLGSGNSDRAQVILSEVYRLARSVVQLQYGDEAMAKVPSVMGQQNG